MLNRHCEVMSVVTEDNTIKQSKVGQLIQLGILPVMGTRGRNSETASGWRSMKQCNRDAWKREWDLMVGKGLLGNNTCL